MAHKKSNTIRSTSWSETPFSQHEIQLIAPAEIAAYLEAHANLAKIVPLLCAQARKDFGENAELTLSVYHDPEIDDHYLELNVRLPAYDDSFAARLESVSEPFDAELCKASGYFLVTTDLRIAHTKHAI